MINLWRIKKIIQVFRPFIDKDRVLKELKLIFESGWIGLGPKTKEFENKLAQYIGVKHFIALNSATSGLHLAIKCLDLPKQSKILTTSNTFISTNHAILYEGHIPIFCDISHKKDVTVCKREEKCFIISYDLLYISG